MKRIGIIILVSVFFSFLLWGFDLSDEFFDMNIRLFQWLLDTVLSLTAE